MSFVKKSVSLPADIDAELIRQAKAQRRTFSNVLLVYLTTETALVPSVEVSLGMHAKRVIEQSKENPVPPRSRHGACRHRIPASAYCQVCDRVSED